MKQPHATGAQYNCYIDEIIGTKTEKRHHH